MNQPNRILLFFFISIPISWGTTSTDFLATQFSVIPWPQNFTLNTITNGTTTLVNNTCILYYSPSNVSTVATALAFDLWSVYTLNITTLPLPSSSSIYPGVGNILLQLVTNLPEPPLPPSPPPPPEPPSSVCTQISNQYLQNTNYNNTDYADGNGPRTTTNASECCALCSTLPNCNYWSFQVDPKVPGQTCHWSTLTYCCWMHTTDANLTTDTTYTSGSRAPEPPMPSTDTLPRITMERIPDGLYTLTSNAEQGIIIQGITLTALHHGSVTLLQLTLPPPSSSSFATSTFLIPRSIPDLSIVDYPFRPWRGFQLDLSSGFFHSLDQLYRAIDIARMVKINILVLHTGAETWMGTVMESVAQMNISWRQNNPLPGCYGGCVFYTQEEMLQVITYGAQRGVGLVPHCEGTPSFLYNINALTTKFNPNSSYADFVDEIDQLGPSHFNGTVTPRFWNAMNIMLNRTIHLFQNGFPDNYYTLPSLHVGAVLGEGGMDDTIAYEFYRILTTIDPNISMSFYDGLCATCNDADHPLYPNRDKMLVHFYTPTYSESPIEDYVSTGWPIVSITWLPLYVLGGSGPYSPSVTFTEFNMYRTNNESYYTGNSTQDNLTKGSMLSTWTMRTPDDVSYARQRLPPMAEKAWHYYGYPVPTDTKNNESYVMWNTRWTNIDQALDRIIGITPHMYTCTTDLQCVPDPSGNGTSYQDDCENKCVPNPQPPVPPSGLTIGGRIFLTNGDYNTSFYNRNTSTGGGIAGADQVCNQEALNYPPPLWTNGSTFKALLVTEKDCPMNNQSLCRRATVTPGQGDGQIDWPIQANSAYYALDGSTLAVVSNSSRLFIQPTNLSFRGTNQMSGMGPGWVSVSNGSCNDWTWSNGMDNGTTFMTTIGWAGYPVSFIGGQLYGCSAYAFFCVEVLPSRMNIGSNEHEGISQ